MLWAIMLVSLVVGVLLYLVLSEWHRRRAPRELRGDWWQQFEREFHAYAAKTEANRSAHARRRVQRERHDRRAPPG
jgi:hypothetical protein